MALYLPKKFAEYCGIPYATVRSDLNRGKLIKSGDYIDSDIYPNDLYVQRKHSESGADIKIPVVAPPKERILRIEKPEYPEPEAPNVGEYDSHPAASDHLSLEKRKQQLTNEKLEEEIKKLRITIEKLEGEVIPTEMVKTVILQLSKAMATAFKNSCDNILDEFAAKSKMSNEERSRIRGRITEETNRANEEGVKLAKKETARIVSEFAVKKGKGERK